MSVLFRVCLKLVRYSKVLDSKILHYDDDFSEVPAACQSRKMFPEVGIELQILGNTCFTNATDV